MPELPEVETTARGLRERITGLHVTGAGAMDWPRMLPNALPDELGKAAVGRTIVSVERRGKYLLLLLDDGASLAVHRKMTGNVLLRTADASPARHTHLVLDLEGGLALHYVDPRKFGRIYLFHTPEARTAFLDAQLGQEPLELMGGAHLAVLLRGRRGRIKSLLLDQTFLAGLGNLYADEALWEARVHPLRSADSLSHAEIKRLAEAIQSVLLRALEHRGTSFSDYRDAEGALGENQDYLNAYGRGGAPCPRCGTALRRLVFGQRSSHYCPRCQRPTRRVRVRRAGAAPGGRANAADPPAPGETHLA